MAKKTTNDNYDIFCSFCNRYKDEVGKLIAGPNGIFICEDCIDICNKISNLIPLYLLVLTSSATLINLSFIFSSFNFLLTLYSYIGLDR